MRGDSNSYQKLLSLNLPAMKGKTFLDVGCNEGFFCGYADFLGAKSVTGVDSNRNFLIMAKTLFPQCDFICQDWNRLGPQTYDVILNASAIHYAEDQKKFLDFLMERLAPGGLLVLEIGVAPGNENCFKAVKRSIDTRYFPTRSKLREMLQDYAYKFIGPSASQAGDPIPREVIHITHKLPFAILLMDNPHAGKTFTIDNIFNKEISRISGDLLYWQTAKGQRTAPEKIAPIIMEGKAKEDWGYVTYRICKDGYFEELCQWIAAVADGKDFILDMYIPASFRDELARQMEKAGFYVVCVNLQMAQTRPRAQEMAPRDSCKNYMDYLEKEYMIDEADYLAANPDVAKAVEEGKITGAFTHFICHGRLEGRPRAPKTKE